MSGGSSSGLSEEEDPDVDPISWAMRVLNVHGTNVFKKTYMSFDSVMQLVSRCYFNIERTFSKKPSV